MRRDRHAAVNTVVADNRSSYTYNQWCGVGASMSVGTGLSSNFCGARITILATIIVPALPNEQLAAAKAWAVETLLYLESETQRRSEKQSDESLRRCYGCAVQHLAMVLAGIKLNGDEKLFGIDPVISVHTTGRVFVLYAVSLPACKIIQNKAEEVAAAAAELDALPNTADEATRTAAKQKLQRVFEEYKAVPGAMLI